MVIIEFLHGLTENIGLNSMSNMYRFTNECICLYCNKKNDFKIPILTDVRAGPGILQMSGPARAARVARYRGSRVAGR